MAKVTMATRKEIIMKQRAAYYKATKKGKGEILDSICMSTGLSRDRAKHLMIEGVKVSAAKNKRGRRAKYGTKVVKTLEKIWPHMDFACGKRLVAGMGDMVESLRRNGEICIDDETADMLKGMSASTADRLLKRAREGVCVKGKHSTKPGTLLKRDIPIRLGDEWDDSVPGYVEIDLVAHCGETTAGEYVNTLDVTDISTGWTETVAVVNKARRHVFDALLVIRGRLPFPLRGIDSDNGGEFINAHLLHYCTENNICFTRSRPGRKNDNCHVEQKNWHVVRRNIGYGRYEGQEAVDTMNSYYSLLRLHGNFFMPQTKLVSKTRDGSRIRKKYDSPKTPYRRVLESEHVDGEAKAELERVFNSLNPVELQREMASLLAKLETLAVGRK